MKAGGRILHTERKRPDVWYARQIAKNGYCPRQGFSDDPETKIIPFIKILWWDIFLFNSTDIIGNEQANQIQCVFAEE